MEPETNPILVSVAEAVADGLPVDWDGLLAAQPQFAEQLKFLRLHQGIIAAHRELTGPAGGAERRTSESKPD